MQRAEALHIAGSQGPSRGMERHIGPTSSTVSIGPLTGYSSTPYEGGRGEHNMYLAIAECR